MTWIKRSADCGNSPKNKAVEDLAIGFETGEFDADRFAEDAVWNRADGSVVKGRADIAAKVQRIKAPAVLTVERVAAHGKVGAASGRVGKAGFAHIFEFASAAAKQVASINSFKKDGMKDG